MSEILLPVPPSGYDATAPAGLNYENAVPHLLFDDTTPEGVFWQFRMPSDYSSAPVLKLNYSMASATSGTMEFEVSLWAASDNESAVTASYDTVNTGTETVPGTAGLTSDLSITLTNADSLAAGDLVRIKLFRDADDATNDTATGDLELWAVSLTYTAA